MGILVAKQAALRVYKIALKPWQCNHDLETPSKAVEALFPKLLHKGRVSESLYPGLVGPDSWEHLKSLLMTKRHW